MTTLPPDPPPAASDPHPRDRTAAGTTLPFPRSSLIGREADIDALTAWLPRETVSLLTLTGPGGVGKTRLALHLAHTLAGAFPAGTVFVPLAAVRDPAMVIPTVARAVGVDATEPQSLVAALRSREHRGHLLLVLDNLEHLLDAVPPLGHLLLHCPALKILATSRIRLGLSGEAVFRVPPLSLAAATHLFVDRARAIDPAFSRDPAADPDVTAICAHLDGLPLAIELAAARADVLPLPAILARIEHRLSLLNVGPRDAPPHLRTMRDAIGWSYDLLPAPEQLVFRRLGVFVGGFTLEAAQAVAGENADGFERIAALAAASLVIPVGAAGTRPRYTMLETIREYAVEQLALHGEEPATRRTHAEYYRDLAEQQIPRYDSGQSMEAMRIIEDDLDNCRTAMSWAFANDATESAVRLAGALWHNWHFGKFMTIDPYSGKRVSLNRVAEGRAWLERALAVRHGLPIEAITEALTGAGSIALAEGRRRDAEAYADELLRRSETAGYAYGRYWACHILGLCHLESGHFDEAERYGLEQLAIAPGIRQPENQEAMALMLLAQVYLEKDMLDVAEATLTRSLALSRQTGNPTATALALCSLGRIAADQGNDQQAARRLSESLATLDTSLNPFATTYVLAGIGLLGMEVGQVSRVVRLMTAASAIPATDVDSFEIAGILEAARSRMRATDYEAARESGALMEWEAVLQDAAALTAEVTGGQVAPEPPPARRYGLTRRELEVLHLLAGGASNHAVADRLSLSERTVENHVSHILAKLELDSRTAAATWAVRHGLA